MITFTYDTVDFSSLCTTHEITGRGTLPSSSKTIEINGRDGVYRYGKRREPRPISVRVSLRSTNPASLRSFVDVFNSLVDLDEVAPLVFSDEPNMTYYAILDGSVDWEEDRGYAFADLQFLCPDPYKYGPEQTATLNSNSSVIVDVGGTAETYPKFNLTAVNNATMLSVIKNTDEYMMIGSEQDIEDTPIIPKESVFSKSGGSLVGWATANAGEVDGTITGTMTTDGTRFKASTYGTGAGWHGPAIKQSLVTPVQDFTVEADVLFDGKIPVNSAGRVEVYLLDASGNSLGKIALKDTTKGSTRVEAEVRAGKLTTGKYIIRRTSENVTSWASFTGMLRITRKGNRWEAYVARVSPTGVHHTRAYATWTDYKNTVTAPVAQIVVHVAQYGTITPITTQQVRNVRVYKLNSAGATEVDFVVGAGDAVTFDNASGDIRRNGEGIKNEKDFGATPFKLSPGENTLTLLPEGLANGTVVWRNAYK